MDLDEFNSKIEATRNSGKEFVAMLALPNCPYCEEFEPIFNAVCSSLGIDCGKMIVTHGSEAKRQHLKAELGEKLAAPATLIFRNGERVSRRFGKMNAEQLRAFIGGQAVPEPKPKTLADLSIQELQESLCRQKVQRAEIDKTIAAIEWEITKR